MSINKPLTFSLVSRNKNYHVYQPLKSEWSSLGKERKKPSRLMPNMRELHDEHAA